MKKTNKKVCLNKRVIENLNETRGGLYDEISISEALTKAASKITVCVTNCIPSCVNTCNTCGCVTYGATSCLGTVCH